jgi:hypothetical protein
MPGKTRLRQQRFDRFDVAATARNFGLDLSHEVDELFRMDDSGRFPRSRRCAQDECSL